MKLKKGDSVKVITGSYKGTIGNITKVFPSTNQVIVEGVNIVKKHLKPSQGNPDGGMIEKEMPINASNVMAYDAKAKKPSRVGYKEEKGKKVRYYKKSNTVIKEGGK
ncbi:MAG: 50S ribosomal protein L24 [Erysipelotrichaceae bacterium]